LTSCCEGHLESLKVEPPPETPELHHHHHLLEDFQHTTSVPAHMTLLSSVNEKTALLVVTPILKKVKIWAKVCCCSIRFVFSNRDNHSLLLKKQGTTMYNMSLMLQNNNTVG
jgi:hypothetical protein